MVVMVVGHSCGAVMGCYGLLWVVRVVSFVKQVEKDGSLIVPR